MNIDDDQSSAFNETAFGSAICIGASAPSKSPNEGGITISENSALSHESSAPRLVIRGESFTGNNPEGGESYELCAVNSHPVFIATPLPKADGEPYAAITDFLNCTFPIKKSELTVFFSSLFKCMGSQFVPAVDRSRGLHGWTQSFSLGKSKALFAIGGQNGTGFLSLPGEACHIVPDWLALISLLRDQLGARITRWDGAVDDHEGTHTVDMAATLWLADKFITGGSRPSCNQVGNWIKPDGTGRTFYVGKRENGKMLRVYDKGMQLGTKWHPWVRWEVEMHNTDRFIPWEVLLEPGKYVAGAYPNAMGWVSKEMKRVKTISETAKLSYETLTHFAVVGYGKHINVMLEVEGSAEKVIQILKRHGKPKRLDLPVVPKGEGRPK